MREWSRLAVLARRAAVTAAAALVTSACSLTDDSGPTEEPQPAPLGPPAPCTASSSSTPFCSSGTCPLLADDTIACPAESLLTTGISAQGALGLGSGPGNGGDIVLAAGSENASEQQRYVELGAFDPTGAATFTVDTFPPVEVESGGGGSNASMSVVVTAQGAPIVLSTISGGLAAAIGSSASGGAFTVEQAVAAPDGDDGGWFLDGAVVDPTGGVDVLLQSGETTEVAHRDATGTWTTSSLPTLGFGSAGIAVDPTGTVYVAGWVPGTAMGTEQLEIIAGSNAPVVVTSLADTAVSSVQMVVGKNTDGSPLPVAAFGTTLTLAVPDGKGGFTTIQPSLTVQQPFQDGCTSSASLGNCSCPQSCSQMGDTASWVQLVRDAQGDVYVAWLEVNTDMTYPVTLNSTSYGGQMITCSCDPDMQSGTGSVTGVGLQLERLVMSAAPTTQHRGTIQVPSGVTGSLQAVDGNGTIQLLVSVTSTDGTGALRRVVLDASKLP